MVVTSKTRAIAVLVPLAAILIVAFQNCTVELSNSTYGAAVACSPDPTELTAFETVMTDFFQSTGSIGGNLACGNCHLTTSGNPAAGRFGVLPGTTASVKTANFCSSISKADDFSGGFLSDGRHGGPTYSTNDVQLIVDWANSLQE